MASKKQKGIVFSKTQWLADKLWPVWLFSACFIMPFALRKAYRELKQAEENNKQR